MEVERDAIAYIIKLIQTFALFLFTQRRNRKDVLVARLVGQIVIKPIRFELETRPPLGRAHFNALHRRREVGHVKTPNQRLAHIGVHKLQGNIPALAKDRRIDPGIGQGQNQQPLALGRTLKSEVRNFRHNTLHPVGVGPQNVGSRRGSNRGSVVLTHQQGHLTA